MKARKGAGWEEGVRKGGIWGEGAKHGERRRRPKGNSSAGLKEVLGTDHAET